MSNKIGIVKQGRCGKLIVNEMTCFKCGETVDLVIDLPKTHKDVPEGFIAYLDDAGILQFMDEDPHDYR